MLSAMGGLIPIAVAMAVSSVPITATLIILLSPSRTKTSVPFLVGWVVGIAVVVLAAAYGVLALPVSRRERMTAIAIAAIVVGCALTAFGILTWRRSNRAANGNRKSWLDGVGSMGRLASLGVGFAMAFRPKALLLGAAAGLALAGARLNPTETAAAVSVYVGISASTVAVPVVWTLTSPNRMESRLLAWRDWLNRHGPLLRGLLMMIIGVLIAGAGVAAL